MALSSVPAEYRWKAQQCRFLVKSRTDEVLAKSLIFLAHEYEVAATAIEQACLACSTETVIVWLTDPDERSEASRDREPAAVPPGHG